MSFPGLHCSKSNQSHVSVAGRKSLTSQQVKLVKEQKRGEKLHNEGRAAWKRESRPCQLRRWGHKAQLWKPWATTLQCPQSLLWYSVAALCIPSGYQGKRVSAV